jgi:hypothetical protein
LALFLARLALKSEKQHKQEPWSAGFSLQVFPLAADEKTI